MAISAVIYVQDLERMQAFYAESFGLDVLDVVGGVRVLGAGDVEVTLVPAAGASDRAIATAPRRRSDAAVKVALEVASIAEATDRVVRRGGSVDDPSTRWEFRARRRVDALDPEGNVIELREPLDA